jgi:LPPG:FO 2-phospho-L-lactate transferase
VTAVATGHVLAISGGVGGAKLALGLARSLQPEQLTIVANTADDFEHLGLAISPDLDTVMYTLAGVSNQQQGWGLADESWNVMSALQRLGGQSWFRLGDRDLATHLERSSRLAKGQTLTEVTDYLCDQLAVSHRILPMTDDPVRTMVKTATGDLTFQHYFVREHCQPAVSGFYFSGIEQAVPQQRLMELLTGDELSAVIICPSNPFVSVEPILQLAGVRQALMQNKAPVIAVSPIVSGMAIKGPAAKMMAELAMPVTATALAEYYADLLDGFVIDSSDRALQASIESSGCTVHCTDTVMHTLDDRIELAKQVLFFAQSLS